MTDDEIEILAPLNRRMARISASPQTSKLQVRLTFEAAKRLRDLSEMAAECEFVVQALAGRVDPSKEALQKLADGLRVLHRAMDDLILPTDIVG